MFDNIQAYAGKVIGDVPSDQSEFESALLQSEPQTPEEIIEYAQREAEGILEAARQEAAAEREAILQNAVDQSEQQIAKNVINAAVNLKMEIWSSKVAMGKILSDALDTIVGRIGHDRMVLSAIEKASEDYGKNQSIIIYGNTKTLERLRLVAIGSKRNLKEFGFSFKLDAGLVDGRCILSRDDSRIEVGLDAQIEALKKVFYADVSRASKDAQAQLNATGKLN